MKLVRESINEKFKEKSDPIKDMDIGLNNAAAWAHEMVSVIEDYKFTEFGGSLSSQDIKIDFLTEDSADVTAILKVPNAQFNLYFNIRDNRRWTDPTPKWESEVSISSPSRRGFFSKKATGKNTTPKALIQKLSDIFNLKYRRR